MKDDEPGQESSGGVYIGGNANVGGDVVGHDKIVYGGISRSELDRAFQPVAEAVAANPQANQKLEELKSEVSKGKSADDGVVAKLLDSVIALVPAAVTGVASAFGTPILAGIAGPVTKYVLGKMQAD